MSVAATGFSFARIRCYYRPLILIVGAVVHTGRLLVRVALPRTLRQGRAPWDGRSRAWPMPAKCCPSRPTIPFGSRSYSGRSTWLDAMKIGMTFGVLLGALLHTVLRYYPLKIGKNLYLNSLKGALVGVPMGVCAKLRRAHGLRCDSRPRPDRSGGPGFLFSSPNFNPVVVMMTFSALPLSMSLTKYAVLLAPHPIANCAVKQ